MTNINPDYKYFSEYASIKSVYDLMKNAEEPHAVEELLEAKDGVIETIIQKSSLWTTIAAFFANLFGKVSDYQRLQREVEKLESEIEKKVDHLLSPSTQNKSLLAEKLAQAQAEINNLGLGIIADINVLLLQFDEVDEHLSGLERQCERQDLTDLQFPQNAEDASKIANFLNAIQPAMITASHMYCESNTIDLTPIITLYARYEAVEKRLKEIQEKQIAQWIAHYQSEESTAAQAIPKTEPLLPVSLVGGIRNGGNSCYLASAIQTIHAVPSYRRAFDPEQNVLKRDDNESLESFEERQQIQKQGFEILQKIGRRETVAPEEINTFRQTCYNHHQAGYKKDKRVLKSLEGMDDSAERLERLLTVMDYPFGSFQILTHRTPITTQPSVDYDLDPKKYSTLEEFTQEKAQMSYPTLEVAALSYLGASVDMQQLIEEAWSDETIEDIKIQSVDDKGTPCVKVYQNFLLRKKVNLEEAPEVIRVTVQQLEENKATITRAKTIHPFGVGNGPEYCLKAIIEHRPNHYVAHFPQKDGSMMEANDSWVHAGEENVQGFAYYYVRAVSKD